MGAGVVGAGVRRGGHGVLGGRGLGDLEGAISNRLAAKRIVLSIDEEVVHARNCAHRCDRSTDGHIIFAEAHEIGLDVSARSLSGSSRTDGCVLTRIRSSRHNIGIGRVRNRSNYACKYAFHHKGVTRDALLCAVIRLRIGRACQGHVQSFRPYRVEDVARTIRRILTAENIVDSIVARIIAPANQNIAVTSESSGRQSERVVRRRRALVAVEVLIAVIGNSARPAVCIKVNISYTDGVIDIVGSNGDHSASRRGDEGDCSARVVILIVVRPTRESLSRRNVIRVKRGRQYHRCAIAIGSRVLESSLGSLRRIAD